MSELTPITRIESYLDAIVNSGIPPLEDITRIETFLQAIYDNQVCQLTPITRIEMFLGKISGQDIVLPEPITRIELYLAAIAGEDVELPEEPITRIEMYLAEWADSGDWTTISGAIVEFITQRAHKLKSCVVSLEPKQDLHGYDAPWPAGGGVNKWDEETELGGLSTADGSEYPSTRMLRAKNYTAVAPGASYYFVSSVSLTIIYYDENKQFVSVKYGTGAKETPSTAAFVRFQLTEDYGTTYKHDTAINNPATVTTYSPFSNICPISGWAGVSVSRAGKNLFDQSSTPTIMDCYAEDGSVTTRRAYKIELPSGTYTFSATKKPDISTGAYIYLNKVNADGSFVSFHYFITGSATSTTITLSLADGQYFLLYDAQASLPSSENKFSYFDFQIELGDTATDYEPYNGNSYSVTWEDEAGTVYGGTVDLVSGVLTLTHAMLTKNTADMNNNEDYPGWSGSGIAAIIGENFNNRVIGAFSNISPQSLAECGGIGANTFNNRDTLLLLEVYLHKKQSEWIALALDVQIVAPLATPITIQLTPQQITALKGYNAMWSDAQSIEVTVHGTPVEVETLQALNMLLGGAYRNNQTADDVSDEEALEIILGGENK